MTRGISRLQNTILLSLERIRQDRAKLRARGVPMPDRVSRRRLLERLAWSYGKAAWVRGRSHVKVRMKKGEATRVEVRGKRRVRVDRIFTNTFYRSLNLLDKRYGVDILSAPVTPTVYIDSLGVSKIGWTCGRTKFVGMAQI